MEERLLNIKNVKELKLSDDLSREERKEYAKLFTESNVLILQDGTKVQPIKREYKCILHGPLDFGGVQVYKINNENLYKCFDCGELLVERLDLIDKYYNQDILWLQIQGNILFPKRWSEEKIIKWIQKKDKIDKKILMEEEKERSLYEIML